MSGSIEQRRPAPRSTARAWLALFAVVALILLPARVVAEDLGAPSSRVSSAFDLLSSMEETSDLPRILDEHGVEVRFVSMAPAIYARYSVPRQVIEVDTQWSDADPVTLAAVIAHEAVHARDSVNGYLASGGASACIDSEVRAFRLAAHFWTEMHGPEGKVEPSGDLERQLNLIAEQEQRDPSRLEDLIREAYVDQCGKH